MIRVVRLAPKLVLFMVAVAGVPLGLAGVNAITLSRTVTTDQVHDAHLRLAENLADSVQDFVLEEVASLSTASHTFPFASLDPVARRDALKVMFFQMPSADLLTLVDGKGKDLVDPVAVGLDPNAPASLAKIHASRDVLSLERFHQILPLEAAFDAGGAASPLYDASGERGPHVAIAVKIDDGMAIAAEISLDRIRSSLTAFHIGKRGEAFLVDGKGRIAAHKDASKAGEDLSGQPFIASRIQDHIAAPGEFVDPSGVRWIAAYAPVQNMEWGIVVGQPEAEAFVASRRLTGQTALWMGTALLFAVVLAIFYAREVGAPVGALALGAGKLAKGELGTRVQVESRDEIGELAAAFNDMASKLQASIQEVERQNQEIKGWNATLAQKVEERTRELREAQARLVQQKKLAALGELGAGLAHELNNPLAGIKGFAQLLLMGKKEGDKEFKPLKNIEDGAKRCADIVGRMLRFSQEAAGTGREKVDFNAVVKDAIMVFDQRLKDSAVELVLELDEKLPPILGAKGELREVCWHILSNAKNAMAAGGRLKINSWSESTPQGDEVKISFADTGKGIDPDIIDRIFEPFFTTKDQWRGTGLGLAVVHRIVTDHGGTITVHSKPATGATFVLSFPKAVEGQVVETRETTPSAARPKTQLV
jgi:two-component system NtrC family sensor kinase